MSGASPQVGEGFSPGFSRRLIDWQRQHGRKGLPWQSTRDPYRVWLSEVMLQQTQVSTVLSYYPRFLQRFPDVRSLAQAPEDEVMALWAGLGYYSRARNLHRCALTVVEQHDGVFPPTAQQLQSLPGIGASTAAAIAAFCFGERVSILDGNVRRVLARTLHFDQDLARPASQRDLWSLAQQLLPEKPTLDEMTAYTQGLMDLGATVCLRSRPLCERCPMLGLCQAQIQGHVASLPVKTRTLKRRHESWWLLLMRRQAPHGVAQVWLTRRPAPGIWAGLYCTPVFDSPDALLATVPPASHDRVQALEPVAHSLTHRELRLHPWLLDWSQAQQRPGGPAGEWVDLEALDQVGLPAPVKSLLSGLSG